MKNIFTFNFLIILIISLLSCKKNESIKNNSTTSSVSDSISKYPFYYNCKIDDENYEWYGTKIDTSTDYPIGVSYKLTNNYFRLTCNTNGGFGYEDYTINDFNKISSKTYNKSFEFEIIKKVNNDSIGYKYQPRSNTDYLKINYTTTPLKSGDKIIGTFNGIVTLYGEYNLKNHIVQEYEVTNPSKIRQVEVSGKLSGYGTKK